MSISPVSITNGQYIVIQTAGQNGTTNNYNILVSENSSMLSNISYRSFYLKSFFPQSSYLSIINTGEQAVTFQLNLNDSLFLSMNDLVNEINTLQDEVANEPIERKAWRFIFNNRYHWPPLTTQLWYHDPTLFFNSIGFGYCDDAATAYYFILKAFGFAARQWTLNGHVVPEVFVSGRWEVYDSDLQVYYYNHNGQIAGVEELEQDPGLISNPINPISTYGDGFAYSSLVASLYASIEDNFIAPESYFKSVNPNYYHLQFQLPSSGALEFPYIFATPPPTINTEFPYPPIYTNARILIPKGSSFDDFVPLVIHAITPALSQLSMEVTMDATSPVIPGVIVTFSANATGGSGNYEYYYKLYDPNSKLWSVEQVYGSNNIWRWDTNGLEQGNYTIEVRARNKGTNVAYDVYKHFNMSISPNPITYLDVAIDHASPQITGTTVICTASASGGSGTFEYYFSYYNPDTGSWTVAQAYSNNNVWRWDTTGLKPGDYIIEVRARNAGANVAYGINKRIFYSIIPIPPPPPATGVTLMTDKISPQVQGTVVTFTAAATGGSGNYEYFYTMLDPVTGKWITGQAYSGNAVWTWNTAGANTGTYVIQVWARSVGSTASYEASKGVNYTINPQ